MSLFFDKNSQYCPTKMYRLILVCCCAVAVQGVYTRVSFINFVGSYCQLYIQLSFQLTYFTEFFWVLEICLKKGNTIFTYHSWKVITTLGSVLSFKFAWCYWLFRLWKRRYHWMKYLDQNQNKRQTLNGVEYRWESNDIYKQSFMRSRKTFFEYVNIRNLLSNKWKNCIFKLMVTKFQKLNFLMFFGI